MREFYWEKSDSSLDDGPLTHIIYEKEKDKDTLFCWTYSQEEAEYIVKCLNQFSRPISALAFKISEIIDNDLTELDKERRDLQAKVLHYSNQLKGDEQKVFESYFQIKRIKLTNGKD